MPETLTNRSKTLYRYEGRENAELITKRGYLLPTMGDHYLALCIGSRKIPLRKIDDSVDINGNRCRGSETPCIFLTQSYPFYERDIGQLGLLDYVFPISASEILDQKFLIYKSPKRGCGNIWVIPDPDNRPLHIDVSKNMTLDWKWYLYAQGISPLISPLQVVHRGIKKFYNPNPNGKLSERMI
jgi:hypothetical protein